MTSTEDYRETAALTSSTKHRDETEDSDTRTKIELGFKNNCFQEADNEKIFQKLNMSRNKTLN